MKNQILVNSSDFKYTRDLCFQNLESITQKKAFWDAKKQLCAYNKITNAFFQKKFSLLLGIKFFPNLELQEIEKKFQHSLVHNENLEICELKSPLMEKMTTSLYDVWGLQINESLSVPVQSEIEQIDNFLIEITEKIAALESFFSKNKKTSLISNVEEVKNSIEFIILKLNKILLLLLQVYFFRQNFVRFVFQSFKPQSMINELIQRLFLIDIKIDENINYVFSILAETQTYSKKIKTDYAK